MCQENFIKIKGLGSLLRYFCKSLFNASPIGNMFCNKKVALSLVFTGGNELLLEHQKGPFCKE